MTRADSAFYNADVVAAIRRGGARFSITARMDKAVTAAVSAIPDTAWPSGPVRLVSSADTIYAETTGMFWFWRKKLVGSYLAFSATRRS